MPMREWLRLETTHPRPGPTVRQLDMSEREGGVGGECGLGRNTLEGSRWQRGDKRPGSVFRPRKGAQTPAPGRKKPAKLDRGRPDWSSLGGGSGDRSVAENRGEIGPSFENGEF